jgi:hypothetical protein
MLKETAGIIILAFIVIIGLGLQFDDELNPEVIDLLEKYHENSQQKKISQAYFYLLGFMVAENDEPIKIGKEIFKSIQQGEKNALLNNVPFTYKDYPEKLKTLLPEGDIYCQLLEPNCSRFLFQDVSVLESTLEKYKLILKRYNEFIQYNDYSTLTQPTISEPLPYFYPAIKANRLLLVKSIVQAKHANTDQAMTILNDNRRYLRQQLSLQDTLIGKMVFVQLIANNLDVSFLLSREYEAISFQPIAMLNTSEKDLEGVMAREFKMNYDWYQSMAGNPEIFEQGGDVPEWYVDMIYKPNMTINTLFPAYKKIIELAKLTPVMFLQSVSKEKPNTGFKITQIRNIVGFALNQIGGPNYNDYIVRFFDLDSKILLFNSLINQQDIKLASEMIANPYYPTQYVSSFSSDEELVCFPEGPLPNDKNRRCLRIKY